MHGVMDLAKKTVSPKTYPCKLCMVTYSGATMNKLWRQYVADLGILAVFIHKNEFVKTYPKVGIEFPAILLKTDKTIKILLSADDFKSIKDLPELMKILDEKLKNVR
jgi:hypothetical protein